MNGPYAPMMGSAAPMTMASPRFPILEMLDALRQLWYVPTIEVADPLDPSQTILWWDFISRSNPNWQLQQRRRYSLTHTNKRGRRVRDASSPFVPPVPESEDNYPLIAPVLYDNVNEFGIAATTTEAAITGVTVEYVDGQAGTLDDPKYGEFQFARYNVFLFVANQNAPTSRLLRYTNWFLNQLIYLQSGDEGGVQPKLDDILSDYNVSGLIKPILSGPFSNINRQASTGIVIDCALKAFTSTSDPTSDQDVFEPLTPNDPNDPDNLLKL